MTGATPNEAKRVLKLARDRLYDEQFPTLDAARRARLLLPRCSPAERPVLEWAARRPDLLRGVLADITGLLEREVDGKQYRMEGV